MVTVILISFFFYFFLNCVLQLKTWYGRQTAIHPITTRGCQRRIQRSHRENVGCQSRLNSTWSFLALLGFSLPLRVMSALKEISEIPPSKRRELVRVQGGGTQPDPNGQSFPQDTLCTKASLPPLQRRHRFKDTAASPKKKSEIPTVELEFILILLLGVGCTTAVMPTRPYMFSHPHGFQKEFPVTPNGMFGVKFL